jgi:DNA-binding SARP family transcriptional activator
MTDQSAPRQPAGHRRPPFEQPFCFHLLCGLQITRADEQVPVPPHRTHGLLAALLLRPNIGRRERLIGLLSPDIPESAGRRRLSDLLWLLRQSMPALTLESDAQEVFLPTEVRWLDVEAFRLAAASDNLGGWLQALNLYHGDLLEGVYDDWLLEERESLRLLYARVSHRAGDELLRQGRIDDLLPLAERLTQAEPYDEKALRTLLKAYQAAGRRGAALAAYDRFVAVAADELGTSPEPATDALAQAIRLVESQPPAISVHSGDDAPDVLLRRAREALMRGDRAGTEAGLHRLRAHPDYREDDARLLEIDLALFLGDYERAENLLGPGRTQTAQEMARAAQLTLARHDAGIAQDAASEALMLAHETADRETELEALLALAAAQREQGRHVQATRSAERALALARQLPSSEGIARALNTQGSGQLSQARYAQALAHFYEARSVALENGLRYHLATALRGIRVAQLHTNRLGDALTTIQEELSIWRDLGLQCQEAVALEGLALILDYLGRSADSLRAMEQALQISRHLGDPVRLAASQYNLAYSLLYQDDANAPRAAEVARQALDAFRTHNQKGWEAVALTVLAYAHWVSGQHDRALTFFRQAYAVSEQVGNLGYLPELLAYQGLASLGLNRRDEALALTRRAVLSMAQGEVSQEVVPEIYYAHAAALAANGMDEQASGYLAQAYEHLLRSASKLEDEAARQAFFHRNPTMRRLMEELYAREMAPPPAEGVISLPLPALQGARPVQVRWTVDAGPPDTALRQARGAIALRRSRLARLLREAQGQGASPTPEQLAEALGVSKRTIQRDVAALR